MHVCSQARSHPSLKHSKLVDIGRGVLSLWCIPSLGQRWALCKSLSRKRLRPSCLLVAVTIVLLPNNCNKHAHRAAEDGMEEERHRDGVEASADGCFDCNICLDFAAEPVVTLCGHLYCWPCMYKWLQQRQGGGAQCPVCKFRLSPDGLVPLYGQGHHGGKRPQWRPETPRRPPPPLRDATGASEARHPETQPRRHRRHNLSWDYTSPAGGALGGIATSVLPWMPRDQGSTRLRRREMVWETSLHHIWVFLCCCALLCLLLF
ncbi:hypothetical protein BHM03_00047419 [Ensete ventricosum]|uniref:E3 ubiquitin-protein ligase RMA n=2 Tax=Ensete ventricosum TaxID=4639 RepID=A0A445ML50_ENSVE|nr:hypothetical protein BHM03_00047419 [Ensete ventricosum]